MPKFGHERRRERAAERAKERGSRSAAEQLDIVRMRRGDSQKEVARLRRQLRKEAEVKGKVGRASLGPVPPMVGRTP